MLSFEINKAAFENEVEHAIRVLYLSYWIGHVADSIENRVDAMKSAREKMNEEIESLKTEFNTIMELIPDIEAECEGIANQVEYMQDYLKKVEEKLLKRAKDIVEERHRVPWWKKAFRFMPNAEV